MSSFANFLVKLKIFWDEIVDCRFQRSLQQHSHSVQRLPEVGAGGAPVSPKPGSCREQAGDPAPVGH